MRNLTALLILVIGMIANAPALANCGDLDMRQTTTNIVIHCSASTPDMDIGAVEIDRWHKARGWRGIGYHAVIRLDGRIEFGRHFDDTGAHVAGHNDDSVGICVVGGLNHLGLPACTFKPPQLVSLGHVISIMQRAYPGAEVLGHRDLSPDTDGDGVVEPEEWLKDCPCMDVRHFVATGEAVFSVEPESTVT